MEKNAYNIFSFGNFKTINSIFRDLLKEIDQTEIIMYGIRSKVCPH